MHYICTGKQLFEKGSNLEDSLDFDLTERLKDYEEDKHFKDMVDLLS